MGTSKEGMLKVMVIINPNKVMVRLRTKRKKKQKVIASGDWGRGELSLEAGCRPGLEDNYPLRFINLSCTTRKLDTNPSLPEKLTCCPLLQAMILRCLFPSGSGK